MQKTVIINAHVISPDADLKNATIVMADIRRPGECNGP